MVSFFCNRLEDDDSIREVCDGLISLIGMSAFSATNVREILQGYVQSLLPFPFIIINSWIPVSRNQSI